MHTCINVERKRAHFDISIIIKIKSNTINNSFSVVTPSLQNLLFIRFTPIIKSLNQLNPKMTPPPQNKIKLAMLVALAVLQVQTHNDTYRFERQLEATFLSLLFLCKT